MEKIEIFVDKKHLEKLQSDNLCTLVVADSLQRSVLLLTILLRPISTIEEIFSDISVIIEFTQLSYSRHLIKKRWGALNLTYGG